MKIHHITFMDTICLLSTCDLATHVHEHAVDAETPHASHVAVTVINGCSHRQRLGQLQHTGDLILTEYTNIYHINQLNTCVL